MDRSPTAIAIGAINLLKHRSINDPEEIPGLMIYQIATLANF